LSGWQLSRRAVADLKEVWDYIAEDSFDAADRLLEDIDRAFQKLADMPRIGHRRPDLTSRDVFFWPVHSYLVVYKTSRPLRIVRVIHAKRDLSRLLKSLKSG
jgi:plasmid stabilization system protein ParE